MNIRSAPVIGIVVGGAKSAVVHMGAALAWRRGGEGAAVWAAPPLPGERRRSDQAAGALAARRSAVAPRPAGRRRFELHLGGRSLAHSVLMMIPEAWENHAEMDPARRAFYEFHSTLI